VERELPWMNVVLRAGLCDQALRERRALARAEHQPDDVATEDLGPLDRAEELDDVPAPHFVGAWAIRPISATCPSDRSPSHPA